MVCISANRNRWALSNVCGVVKCINVRVAFIFQAIHATRWDLRIWWNLSTIQSLYSTGYTYMYDTYYTSSIYLYYTDTEYECVHRIHTYTYICVQPSVWTSWNVHSHSFTWQSVSHVHKVFELHLKLAKKNVISSHHRILVVIL